MLLLVVTFKTILSPVLNPWATTLRESVALTAATTGFARGSQNVLKSGAGALASKGKDFQAVGKVVKSIKKGEHVHVHNVKTKKW